MSVNLVFQVTTCMVLCFDSKTRHFSYRERKEESKEEKVSHMEAALLKIFTKWVFLCSTKIYSKVKEIQKPSIYSLSDRRH